MNCLICNAELTHVNHEGVTVDSCPSGHGLWLDQGELQKIAHDEVNERQDEERHAALEHARGSSLVELVTELSTDGQRQCPVCQRAMDKLQYDGYSGITIDSCSEHGVWLDDGELERVEAYAEGTRRTLTGSNLPDDPAFLRNIAAGAVLR